MPREFDDLYALAALHGLETSYYDVFGHHVTSPPEAVLGVLRALGAPVEKAGDAAEAIRACSASSAQRFIEPVTVAWDADAAVLPMNESAMPDASTIGCTLELEAGEVSRQSIRVSDLRSVSAIGADGSPQVSRQLTLGGQIPFGFHRVTLELGGATHTCLLIRAPRETYQGHDAKSPGRHWGVFAPLYALHSERSWGAGDFSDLESLVDLVGAYRGSTVATLPLLATFLDHTATPSPYSPASRLFWNEFYIDVTRVPELESTPPAQALIASDSFQRELASLRAEPMCDYMGGMALKRRVLSQLARKFFSGTGRRQQVFREYLQSKPQLEDYARFRATTEKRETSWHTWPAPLRDGTLRDGDFDPDIRDYHAYVQWLADEQLGGVARKARELDQGLYLDLPLGVHPDGYDVWRERAAFATGVSVGAPPDTLFSAGQNWGFPPLHPVRIREQGYRYLIACIRHHLRYAGILRIDHVMGLHRLFWVTNGMRATDGVYVRQRPDEQYAILSLESHRSCTVIVGEDLGTVPESVRAAMIRHGVKRTYVAQYDLRPDPGGALGEIPGGAVAALNTHDMPTFSGFWEGMDIDDRHALGLIDEQQRVQLHFQRRTDLSALADFLRSGGFLGQESDRMAVYRACLRYLAESKAGTVLVNLEDLWQERWPQNVPGTCDERPNWRRKARYESEAWRQIPGVIAPLQQMSAVQTMEGPVNTIMPKTNIDNKKTRTAAGEVRYDVSLFTDDDLFLFNEGTHYQLYDKLGGHAHAVEGVDGACFAVWAPDAERVFVIGDFNGWNKTSHELRPKGSSGIWEGFIPGLGRGSIYKYWIQSRYNGYSVEKADPFALHFETPPKTGSIIWDIGYRWGDADWMENRARANALDSPVSVYEVHLGSWMRVPDEGDRFLTYRELASKLTDYVQQLGFTHVEFMPVMEHPFYGSWGYQTTGYFAPTSRYGTPQDFMYLADYMHQHGIGVILDWVPSHFPTDEYALGYFDGTHLFEHADERLGFHPDWKSSIFNYGRKEVRSFLLSSAMFWLDKFHVDGLRVDAVASMLYLDYSRKAGEWIPNQYGGRENLEALSFLRQFNEAVYKRFPDVQTIAEESTDWPMVSRPTYVGGLGFGLKWDMGWMHDTLVYISKDPIHRKYHHNELTFRMLYAFTENFALPLSHDEVVHGKGSLLGRMPGDDWQRFANLRLLYGYMFAQPGKKLLFMGDEFGQWNEWNHDVSLDWHLLEFQPHQGIQKWVTDLNRVYRGEPSLYECDTDPSGFEWIDCSDWESSTVSLIRKGRTSRNVTLIAANFTPVPRLGYRVGVPFGGVWQEILNSDAHEYGGSGIGNFGGITAEGTPKHGRPCSLVLNLPPLAVVFLRSPAE